MPAVALDNARMYAEARAHEREVTGQADASREFSAMLRREEILTALVEAAAHLMPARWSVLTIDPKTREVQPGRRTVSGVTITRGRLQPAQTLASPTQKSRSVGRRFGRVTVRLYTASCWRNARFSSLSWWWPPQNAAHGLEHIRRAVPRRGSDGVCWAFDLR
jgi:hypothetical protein